MIATVTLNTALDRILFLRRFRMGRRIVADQVQTTVGGKGTVVSTLVRQLGGQTRAYGFMAGPAGHVMCALLDKSGVPYEFVEAEGDTRINTVLVDTEAVEQTTVIAETMRVREPHVEKLTGLLSEKAGEASVWVFSGSLPPGSDEGLWARLISLVKESGAKVILDSSGEGVRQGMKARPYLVKPNLPELEEICGRSLPSQAHVRDAAESLLEDGPEWVVVSMGEEGLLAVSADAEYAIPPQPISVVSTSGAGDGLVTGISLALEQNAGMEAALRLGAAVATSVVTQAGTSSCIPADVEKYFHQISVQRLD